MVSDWQDWLNLAVDLRDVSHLWLGSGDESQSPAAPPRPVDSSPCKLDMPIVFGVTGRPNVDDVLWRDRVSVMDTGA